MRPSNRAQSSLRRLVTAFTPSTQGLSPVEENTPTTHPTPNNYTISRLSRDDSFSSNSSATSYNMARSSTGSRFSSHMATSFSSHSLSSLRAKFAIRRSPSQVELEQEEERLVCGDELLGLVEPRPCAPAAHGSFEEVLFGRI